MTTSAGFGRGHDYPQDMGDFVFIMDLLPMPTESPTTSPMVHLNRICSFATTVTTQVASIQITYSLGLWPITIQIAVLRGATLGVRTTVPKRCLSDLHAENELEVPYLSHGRSYKSESYGQAENLRNAPWERNLESTLGGPFGG